MPTKPAIHFNYEIKQLVEAVKQASAVYKLHYRHLSRKANDTLFKTIGKTRNDWEDMKKQL